MIKNDFIQLTLTEDGSQTLYVPAIDETYHSIHGAVNESLHVFLQAGLGCCSKTKVRVLEIGFGTGLNAYLTALSATANKVIEYVSVEKFPLPQEIWSALNYPQLYGNDKALFHRLHTAEWDKKVTLHPNFELYKIKDDICTLTLPSVFDVVYFDAFSPEKQPELWTEAGFSRLFAVMSEGGILTTYCAKGSVRRALQTVGFTVERIPGPTGKREMLRAIK